MCHPEPQQYTPRRLARSGDFAFNVRGGAVCESAIEQANYAYGVRGEALECVQLAAAFSPASLLAGTFARVKEIGAKMRVALVMEIPASELAGRKAAASCTHSKASLRSHRMDDFLSLTEKVHGCLI